MTSSSSVLPPSTSRSTGRSRSAASKRKSRPSPSRCGQRLGASRSCAGSRHLGRRPYRTRHRGRRLDAVSRRVRERRRHASRSLAARCRRRSRRARCAAQPPERNRPCSRAALRLSGHGTSASSHAVANRAWFAAADCSATTARCSRPVASRDPRPLHEAVHARVAQAEPLGGQRPGDIECAGADRGLDDRPLRRRHAGRANRRSAGTHAGSAAARRSLRRSDPAANATTASASGQTDLGRHRGRWSRRRRPPRRGRSRDHALPSECARRRRSPSSAWTSLNAYHGGRSALVTTHRRAGRSGHRCPHRRGAAATAARSSSISSGTPSDRSWWTSVVDGQRASISPTSSR